MGNFGFPKGKVRKLGTRVGLANSRRRITTRSVITARDTPVGPAVVKRGFGASPGTPKFRRGEEQRKFGGITRRIGGKTLYHRSPLLITPAWVWSCASRILGVNPKAASAILSAYELRYSGVRYTLSSGLTGRRYPSWDLARRYPVTPPCQAPRYAKRLKTEQKNASFFGWA